MKCYTFKKDRSLGIFTLSKGIRLASDREPQLIYGEQGNAQEWEEVKLHRYHPASVVTIGPHQFILDCLYEPVLCEDKNSGKMKQYYVLSRNYRATDKRILLEVDTRNPEGGKPKYSCGFWDVICGEAVEVAKGFGRHNLPNARGIWKRCLLALSPHTAVYIRPMCSEPYVVDYFDVSSAPAIMPHFLYGREKVVG